ncbi:hypothetical protein OSTOST_16762, partial [Ostertagia ostertagi]
LRQLPNGTQYGCDGTFNGYTRYNLLSILCLFKSSEDLPATMRATFERLNSKYNKGLVWSEDIASEALMESKSRTTEESYLKLAAIKTFWKTDTRTLEEKVLGTFESRFAEKETKSAVSQMAHSMDAMVFSAKRESTTISCLCCVPLHKTKFVPLCLYSLFVFTINRAKV